MAEETKSSISQNLTNQFAAGAVTSAQANITAQQAALKAAQDKFAGLQEVKAPIQQGGNPSLNNLNIDPAFIQYTQQRDSLQKEISGLQSGIASNQAIIADPTRVMSAQERELVKGSQFGEAVLGPEGLGRLGTDSTIQGIESRLSDLSKGFSAEELVARKEQMFSGINQATSSQSRALQSALARAGVKGGAAGAQLRDVAIGGIQSKANVERDLFIGDRDARTQGLKDFAQFTGEIKGFDLGQIAKEKDIVLQSGLGFASMGSAERSAALQAAAAERAAAASAAAACFMAGTEIVMADGTYKNIKYIELGDMTSTGEVTAIGQAYAFAPIYMYRGDFVTGSHIVEENGVWIRVEDSEESILTTYNEKAVVFPMDVKGGIYYTRSGIKSWSFTEVEGSYNPEESLRLLNEAMNESNVNRLFA